MNVLWMIMILASLIFALINGDSDVVTNLIANIGMDTFNFVVPLVCITCVWNGFLNIAQHCGILRFIKKLLNPVLKRIFKDVAHDEECMEYISSNVAANMFGLGNAATPSGLKAMKKLQEHNKNKDEASRPMITFLVLNTAGITLISSTIIGLRASYDSKDVMSFALLAIISTVVASIVGLIIDRLCNYGNK